MEVFAVYVDRLLSHAEYQQMMWRVSEDRREKVKRFVKPEDGHRGLIGDVLIRTVIRNKFGIQDLDITFASDRYGKPYTPGIPSFHFNISHSGHWVVCAVDCSPLGIDIEQVTPISFEIAHRFFTKEEYRNLMKSDEQERLSYFYDLWTIKESFVKQMGTGLSVPLDVISVNIDVNRQISLLWENENVPCFFKQFDVGPDYKMTVCSATGVFSDHVMLLSYEDLLI